MNFSSVKQPSGKETQMLNLLYCDHKRNIENNLPALVVPKREGLELTILLMSERLPTPGGPTSTKVFL
jgi:hypothetical protein